MTNRLVVIGSPEALNKLRKLADTNPHVHWVNQRDPFADVCK
jgi:hypothetical protein